MTDTWKAVIGLLAAGFVLEAVLLGAVMRQVGSLLLHVGPAKLEPLPAGPRVGQPIELPGVLPDRPAVVLFTSGCSLCERLVPAFRSMHKAYQSQLELIAVVTQQDALEREQYARKLGSFARTDLTSLMQDWDIPGTPYAVALDGRGIVRGAGIINGPDQLEELAVVALGLNMVARDLDQSSETDLYVHHVHDPANVAS